MSLEQTILRESVERPESPQVAPPKPSVFIVDDEAMVGEVVSVVLSLEGFHTRLFTSPTDAIEAFESATARPDLLITDYAMTPLNGVELIERFRQIEPNLRAILYSGNVEEEQLAEYRNAPNAFLSKPFLPKRLLQTVQSVLAR
jgi:two-component system, cell cycle sensor histidine kinase and response regulator CckA